MKIQSIDNFHHSCYTHKDPCHEYPIYRRGPRGIQGLPGVTSTNDNALIYYLNGASANTQTLALGTNQALLLNRSFINGTTISLTATDNNILLSPGIYSVDISTYADATGLTFDAAGETVTITPTIQPASAQLGTTQPFTITSAILQHIFIQSIIAVAAPTQLSPLFTVASTLTPAITGVPFVNTTVKIIRLGNYPTV